MEKHDWLGHWIRDDISFYLFQVNPLLEKFWPLLDEINRLYSENFQINEFERRNENKVSPHLQAGSN